MDGEETLENIRYARAHTVDQVNTLLNYAAGMMLDNNTSLLIVDSIMAVFRADFTGRG